jgi:hypothetical protein
VQHYAFVFATLALNVACWWIIWIMTNSGFS